MGTQPQTPLSGPPPSGFQPPHHGGSPTPRIFAALLLIAAGILLFLANIGLLPIHDIWHYWPLVLIAVGVGRMLGRHPQERAWGVLLVVFGAIFLGSNLGLFHLHTSDGSWIIALILLGVGISTLITVAYPGSGPIPWARRNAMRAAGMHTRRPPVHYSRAAGFPEAVASSENFLQDNAVFSAVKRRIETHQLEGGDLSSVFGNIELDLRLCRMAGPSTTIQVSAVFGVIKLRIPEAWRVAMNVTGAMGNCEDKTLPLTAPDPSAPLLIVQGSYAFGGVEIES